MNGLGSQMQTLLERTIQVPKAAFAKAEDRPTVAQHFASLKVSKELVHSTEILVVDDIVTSGSMLLASVSRLQEAYPDLRIKAFALIRTMSGEEITEIINICAGSIRSRGERAVRNP